MTFGARWRAGVVRLTARRHQRILVAAALTLLTSSILLGLIGLIRWRAHQALQTDTTTVIAQAGRQLVRSLQSRRGTLTFLRDTLARRSEFTPPQLQAMGDSAVEHTRHLLATGLVESAASPAWWSGPRGLSSADRTAIDRAVVRRTQLRGIWRVPSTFTTTTTSGRVFLVMLEPLGGRRAPPRAVIGLFDVKPLLEDFFTVQLPQPAPVQLLDGTTLLYRAHSWRPPTSTQQPIVVDYAITVDAARWMLQMQPSTTRVAQTLSWFHWLLIGLSLVAGLGITIIIWILAARAWILQRAVTRRTAALRRALGRVRELAVTDELTGLSNRRFFLNRWTWEYERAKRYQRPLACLMIDVDGFKQVNDRLGHLTGDLVLKRVAQELKAMLRQSDFLARFGGDEFVIGLPETSLEQAATVAEKLRDIRIDVPHGDAHGVANVSLSVGLSRIEGDDDTPQDILHAADLSLYASKRATHSSA